MKIKLTIEYDGEFFLGTGGLNTPADYEATLKDRCNQINIGTGMGTVSSDYTVGITTSDS